MLKNRFLTVIIINLVIFTLLGVVTNDVKADISSNLMSYWDFNIDYSDQGPQGVDGTPIDGAQRVVGKSGYSLYLDGVDDYVDLEDGFANFTNGITIALWAYPVTFGEATRFIEFANGAPQDNVYFKIHQTGLSYEVVSNTTWWGGNEIHFPSTITPNQWQFVAVTQNYSTKQVKLYNNGNLIGTDDTNSPRNVTRTMNWIGNSVFPFNPKYGGMMDDIRVYNRVLSQSDIEELQNATAGAVINLDSGLNAYADEQATDIENFSNLKNELTEIWIKDDNDDLIANFSLDFEGNIDLSNVSAGVSTSNNSSFFHVPGGFSNIGGYSILSQTFTLYVPVGASDYAVWICPGVSNMNDINLDCSGGYQLTLADPNVSEYIDGNQRYFAVSGLTNTGGLGIDGTPNMRIDLANEAASATDDIEVWFDTPTDITTDSLIYVIYDSLFTGGSSLTVSDISLNCDDDGESGGTSTGMTAFGLTTASDGYLVLDTNTDTCSNWIQVDIQGGGGNHLTNPGNAGNYSWAVLTDVSGDGADDDSGATLAYVGDDNDVNITAIVPPTIDMELYQQGTDTELTDTNTCALGVLSLNQVNTCIYDLGTGTNNSTGVSVYMTSDGSLDDGNGNSIGSPTGAVTSGEEEYGFYLSELGGGEYSAAGSYSTQHQAVPTSVTLIATTSTTGSGTTVGSSSQHLEITHAASMSTSTIVGSYNQVVTYTAYTN